MRKKQYFLKKTRKKIKPNKLIEPSIYEAEIISVTRSRNIHQVVFRAWDKNGVENKLRSLL
jgi:hypothetical protein